MEVPKIAGDPRFFAAPRWGSSALGIRSVGAMASSSNGMANVFTALRMNSPRLTVSTEGSAARPAIGRNVMDRKTAKEVRRNRDACADMKKNGEDEDAKYQTQW